MAKAPKKPSKTTEPAKPKKSTGLLTGTADVRVRVEVKITDKFYELDLLADDIRHKRVWFEPPAKPDGWLKLVYTADGPTGDPRNIGRIRFILDPNTLDPHFADVSEIKVSRTEG